MVVKCKECQKEFKRQHKSRLYCSKKCKGKAAYLKTLWTNETQGKAVVRPMKEDPLSQSIEIIKTSKRKDVVPLVRPLNAEFDIAIVITDVHIPFHSEHWLEKVLRQAYKLRLDNPNKRIALIIGGDFLDLSMFSQFGHNNKDSDAKKSIEDGAIVLRALYKLFDYIYMCAGNHDERFMKALNGHLGFDDLMKMLRSDIRGHIPDTHLLTTSRNFILCQDKTWAIVHPRNYSKIATTVPRKLAELHSMNVISGHTHHPPGYASTSNGLHVGLENGCIQDKSLVGYLKDMTLFPKHMFGFTILLKCNDGKTRFKQISEQDMNA